MAELRSMAKRFTVNFLGKPKLFLGMNIAIESRTRITISASKYMRKQAEKLLPKPLSEYPMFDVPADEKVNKAYERAMKREHTSPPELTRKYKSKIGALIYAPPCGRHG